MPFSEIQAAQYIFSLMRQLLYILSLNTRKKMEI